MFTQRPRNIDMAAPVYIHDLSKRDALPMKILTKLSLAILLAFPVFGAHSVEPLHEIFYVPFEDSPNAVGNSARNAYFL